MHHEVKANTSEMNGKVEVLSREANNLKGPNGKLTIKKKIHVLKLTILWRA